MSAFVRRLERKVRWLQRRVAKAEDFSQYRNDPVGYAEKVLRVQLTPRQVDIVQAVLEPPYRVLVPSGHDVGKTFIGAVLVSWWFDTRNPSVCLTTAPKLDQVKDLLWKEIRAQRLRAGRGGFAGPKSLRLESGPKHWAKGVTANTQAGFQGQHEEAVLIVIDEAEGVDRDYFEAAKTMATGEGHAIVCFYNPYTTASHVAQEERAVDRDGRATWRILNMSSLDHPNVLAELRGEPPPYPMAVRLAKVNQWVQDWTAPIDPRDRKWSDLEWPPGSCQWWRPGPRFEAGAMGRRPTSAVNAVWSDALVDACCQRVLPVAGPLQIGCDVARFGDDYTAIHVRRGGVSIHHEAVNGWSVVQTAYRIMELAGKYAPEAGIDMRQLVLAIDDCGVGGGVVDVLRSAGFAAYGVNVSAEARDSEQYPNLRSALWCDLATEAMRGNVSLARLPQQAQFDLRRELTAPIYVLDTRGRRCVEPKDKTKVRLGRSPDNADAMLLAYCAVHAMGDYVAGNVEVPK